MQQQLRAWFNRRNVTVGGAAAISVAVASVAFAGPIVYSEYTTGGERENRVVQSDGSGDARLPDGVAAISVSPDGQRLAQVGLTYEKGKDGYDEATRSWLRISRGDGSGSVIIVEHPIGRRVSKVVAGKPVWSPDGSRVLVDELDARQPRRIHVTRLSCTVDRPACDRVGSRTVTGESAPDAGDLFETDILGWQAQDGPVRIASPALYRPAAARCGARGVVLHGPRVTVKALWATSSFGAPLLLRGILRGDDRARFGYPTKQSIDPRSVGAITVADGTLAYDAPKAAIRRSAIRCTKRTVRWSGARSIGLPRLRLRHAGRTAVLPRPAGLLREDGLRLVPTADGGALLLSRPSPSTSRGQTVCDRRDDWCNALGRRPGGERPQRVWRYRPGTATLTPVTGISRAGLRTIVAASDFAIGDGESVMAVDDRQITRVPLDGGMPTVVARGEGLALGVAAW